MAEKVRCNCFSGYINSPCHACKGTGRMIRPLHPRKQEVPCYVCIGKGSIKQTCPRGCCSGYFYGFNNAKKIACAGES